MLRVLFFLLVLTFSAQGYAQVDTSSSLLDRFYSTPPHLLWTQHYQLTSQAEDALDFIGASNQQGLDPENYNYGILQELKPQLNEQNIWQFDHLLTLSLLQLVNDLKNGLFPPDQIDKSWTITKPKFDAISFLQQALLAKHLKTTLKSLLPQSQNYQALVDLLAKYQRYQAQGGWPKLGISGLLRPGQNNSLVPQLRHRLAIEDPQLVVSVANDNTNYDSQLEEAVKRFQLIHSLKVDGVVGPATIRALNVSAAKRVQQIRINLERYRWLPEHLGQRYIMINLPTYQLIAVDHGKVALNMKVIVGQLKRQTPSFSSKINHLVINPYWNVPTKLARLDLLPKQQADIDYFFRNNILVYQNVDGKKQEINPYQVDWQQYNRHHLPFTLQQQPGPNNALGRIKFMFPNPWNIYLHDTPHRALFNESSRNFSSGCIRVEHPIELAVFTLNKPDAHQQLIKMIDSGKNLADVLSEPLPVYTVYFTVWADNGQIRFGRDRYHRNNKFFNFL